MHAAARPCSVCWACTAPLVAPLRGRLFNAAPCSGASPLFSGMPPHSSFFPGGARLDQQTDAVHVSARPILRMFTLWPGPLVGELLAVCVGRALRFQMDERCCATLRCLKAAARGAGTHIPLLEETQAETITFALALLVVATNLSCLCLVRVWLA